MKYPDVGASSIRAKFKCASVANDGTNENVNMFPVCGTTDNPANAMWAKYTPGGQLQLTISSPAAQGFFKPQQEYFLDITAAAEPVKP